MAEAFGKEHKNVLKDIDRILTQVPEIFGRLNFEPSEYELKNNLGFPVKHPMYIITKDGFTLLTMGYTGEKAMQFKVAEIFGKRHDHVLRDIEQILTQVPEIFIKPNFGVVEYPVRRGFGKEHRHVLRDIRETIDKCSESLTAPNFGFSEYTDSTGRSLDGVESDIDN